MNSSRERAESSPRTESSNSHACLEPRQFLFLLFGYFALHTLLRGWVSETAGIDDCDQIVRAQIWSWGYGPQPPLYTWLLKGCLAVFGYNIYVVTALKELLLFGIYLLAYANARLLTGSHICAVAAAVAMQFNPSIAWESQRELTHSILTSLFVLATLLCFLRMTANRWRSYIVFGFCVGLGSLSKPNFLFFLGGLLLAAVSLKEKRSVVLNWKMFVALLLAVALCTPTLQWIFAHRDLAASSLHKFKIGEGTATLGKALFKWCTDLIAHLGPTLGIFALVFCTVLPKAKWKTAEEKLLGRTLLAILLLTTTSIVAFKVTGFRDRWLQPIFVWVPLLLVAGFREQLTAIRYKRVLAVGSVIAVAVLLIAPARLLLTAQLKKNEILNSPYRDLADQLRPQLHDVDSIIVGDYRIAGNLRLWFPDKFVTAPEFADLFPNTSGRTVLIWDNPTGEMPAKGLQRFAETVSGKKLAPEQSVVEQTLKYHQARTMQLGIARLE